MTLSPTLAINEEIARRRAQGLPVIALGFGEASIPVHPLLKEELARHAGSGGYGEVAGVEELRTAVADFWTRRDVPTDPGHVVVGPGSKPLLYVIFEALGGPVILPKPAWVSYAAQNRILDRETVVVPIEGEGGFPDPEQLAAECERLRAAGEPARAVLVTIPDNPTGTIASPERVKELCRVAEEQDLVIVSDEIYLDLVHDPQREVVTPSQVLPDRTITTTGLSKNLGLGGWRLGVARFPDTEHLNEVRRRGISVASEVWSAAAHPVQLAAAWAFGEPEPLRAHIAASARLHGAVARAVAGVFAAAGADVAPPAGGFYVYPDFARMREQLAQQGISTGTELATQLLERFGIATLPGTAFGDDDDRLALRVAVPMLYGVTDQERLAALESEDPVQLPWIAESLSQVTDALRQLTRTG
ncbi:MAG: pyridoxal phosphate-dependent aminotransferase [Propionibacteriaceae bacterium]